MLSSPRGSAGLKGGRLGAEGGGQPGRPCPGSAGSRCRASAGACGSGSEAGRWRCLAACQRLLRSLAVTLLPHGRHFKALAAGRCAVEGRCRRASPGPFLSVSGRESLSPTSHNCFFFFLPYDTDELGLVRDSRLCASRRAQRRIPVGRGLLGTGPALLSRSSARVLPSSAALPRLSGALLQAAL